MNISLSILIIEMALVLLLIVCIVGFIIWKRKKTRVDELEALLEYVDDQQAERKAQLVQFLIKDYAQDKELAKESASYMVEAEKQFVQQFIKQQLQQTKVTDFYANLSELLDQYLYFVPSVPEQQQSSKIIEQEKELVEENSFNSYGKANSKDSNIQTDKLENSDDDSLVDNRVENEQETPQQNAEAEPDWGDAFSESGDTMDDDAKAGFDAELKNESGGTEEEPEPDWGDAFSESGDTMDDDAKAGFDAELKNESEGAEEEAEPDWGDAFSESGDTMDDDAKAGYESDLNKE